MKKKIKKGLRCILGWLFIGIACFLSALAQYLRIYFNSTYFEQLLYNLINTDSLHMNSLNQSVATVFLWAVIFLTLFVSPLLFQQFKPLEKKIKFKKWEFTLFPIQFEKYACFVLAISLIMICIRVGVPQFLMNQLTISQLYEDHYVAYEKEKIKFPEQKRNLITIYVESLESSNFSMASGGSVKKSYMPKLEKLAQDNIHFSNHEQLGGFRKLNGTDWTIAGMVAQTAGVPIYINTKNEKNHFLEGVTSIGDILKENGYRNYLMIGSDAEFGERKKYFQEHGDYQILDYFYARDNREIPYYYYTWWGYEDRKLYDFSKEKLTKISKQNEPFNFTMLTVDTHFFDGYTDNQCPKPFADPYANSFYCADIMLNDFLDWIRKQDFYSNTTIVIVGDHLAMRDDFYHPKKGYERVGFNLFLNSAVTTEHTQYRDFTPFDLFPTTLASIGATIDGERLALGTNLFSDEKTLSEELGYDVLAREIQYKSNYYQQKILRSN